MAYQFVVDAKNNSISGGSLVSTGISVSQGQVVAITAPGDEKWTIGSNMTYDANGGFKAWSKNGFVAVTGSLAGTLDGGQSFFPIGRQCEISVLEQSGALSLCCWDENNGDNSGAITATVSVFNQTAL